MESTVICHYTGALETIRCGLEEPNLGLRQNYLRGVKILVQLQPMRAGLAEPDERHSPRWVIRNLLAPPLKRVNLSSHI